MMKKWKKIWNVFTSLLIAVIVTLALLLVGVRFAGLQVFTVLSGSMEPTYHVGALIYVKKVDYKQLAVGDPITFMLDEKTVATHRIVEVLPDAEDPEVLRFRTKGDANDVEDGTPVHYKNVLGKPVFTIPMLGYFANFIQHPPGTYVAIAVGSLILMMIIIPELLDEDEEKESKKGRKKNREGS